MMWEDWWMLKGWVESLLFGKGKAWLHMTLNLSCNNERALLRLLLRATGN